MTTLLTAEKIARSANFQILHRDLHTRTQVSVLRNRGKAFMRGFRQWLFRVVQEVGIRPLSTATHTTTQLM